MERILSEDLIIDMIGKYFTFHEDFDIERLNTERIRNVARAFIKIINKYYNGNYSINIIDEVKIYQYKSKDSLYGVFLFKSRLVGDKNENLLMIAPNLKTKLWTIYPFSMENYNDTTYIFDQEYLKITLLDK